MWKDDLGLMRAKPDHDSTNDILHHAYWIYVSRGKITFQHLKEIRATYYKAPRVIKHTWRDPDWERVASHDNLMGYLYLHSQWGIVPETSMKHYPHPRDWAFYWSYKYQWAAPLFVLYGVIMIHTCWRYYYNKKDPTVIDVDGKLLYLLRREMAPSWWLDPICDRLLAWRYGKEYVKTLFDIYFHHTYDHPIREKLR